MFSPNSTKKEKIKRRGEKWRWKKKVFHVISMAYTLKHKNDFFTNKWKAESLFFRESWSFVWFFHTPEPNSAVAKNRLQSLFMASGLCPISNLLTFMLNVESFVEVNHNEIYVQHFFPLIYLRVTFSFHCVLICPLPFRKL